MPKDTFAQTGRQWFRDAVSAEDLKRLSSFFPDDSKPGARLAANDPLFQAVGSLPFQSKITERWPGMRSVRMVTFNKSEHSN